MEESLFRHFKGDRHRDMLTIGQGTLLQIRVLRNKGLQFKLRWLSVTTVKKKVILLDSALNQKGLRNLHYNGDTIIPAQASQEIPTPTTFQTDDVDAFILIVMMFPRLRQFSWLILLPMTQTFF
ncbi:hypothetical protein Tco_1088864 [Tanacetum coccineum]